MKLNLKRKWFSGKSTIGELYVDGEFCCFTLEDVERTEKTYGETAIPCGTYPVIVTPSRRFRRLMPLLVGVPNFSGIRIHPGNDDGDTEGCILVGMSRSLDFIGRSREAFNELFILLADCHDANCSIEIEDAPG
jgi:hypothetical protein